MHLYTVKGMYVSLSLESASILLKQSVSDIGFIFMTVYEQVLRVLDEALSLQGRTAGFETTTPLLGSLPELDSMAVLSLITGLECRFGVTFRDEDLNPDVFATVGSLTQMVKQQLTEPPT